MIWRFSYAAVVEIEGVNVNVGLEGHKKQKPRDHSSGLAPLARRLGGDIREYDSTGSANASSISPTWLFRQEVQDFLAKVWVLRLSLRGETVGFAVPKWSKTVPKPLLFGPFVPKPKAIWFAAS